MQQVEKAYDYFLTRGNDIQWMNRIAGSLMVAVGVWRALG